MAAKSQRSAKQSQAEAPRSLVSLRSAVVLALGAMIGLGAGVLALLDGRSPAGAALASFAAVGGAVALLNWVID